MAASNKSTMHTYKAYVKRKRIDAKLATCTTAMWNMTVLSGKQKMSLEN